MSTLLFISSYLGEREAICSFILPIWLLISLMRWFSSRSLSLSALTSASSSMTERTCSLALRTFSIISSRRSILSIRRLSSSGLRTLVICFHSSSSSLFWSFLRLILATFPSFSAICLAIFNCSLFCLSSSATPLLSCLSFSSSSMSSFLLALSFLSSSRSTRLSSISFLLCSLSFLTSSISWRLWVLTSIIFSLSSSARLSSCFSSSCASRRSPANSGHHLCSRATGEYASAFNGAIPLGSMLRGYNA